LAKKVDKKGGKTKGEGAKKCKGFHNFQKVRGLVTRKDGRGKMSHQRIT